MDYGKAVRLARTARGLSQKGLAARSGLNTSYVSLIETGKRVPGPRAIGKLSKALGVPGYLLALLGADAKDLVGLSPEQAALVGGDLLTVLTSVPEKE